MPSSWVDPTLGPWSAARSQPSRSGRLSVDRTSQRWLAYSDDISDAATISVHFHRSWTGAQIIRVDMQVADIGSTLTRATWAMDAAVLKNPGEAYGCDTLTSNST
jgi:hypothetical protein